MNIFENATHLFTVTSFFLAVTSLLKQSKTEAILYFRNIFKPIALCLAVVTTPYLLKFLGNIFREGIFSKVDLDFLIFLQSLSSLSTLFFYILVILKKDSSISKNFYKLYYAGMLGILLLLIPFSFGKNHPASAAFAFAISYIVTSSINRFFLGHHFNQPFFKLQSELIDIFKDWLCFRSHFSINYARGHHAYTEALLPLLFTLSIFVLISQKAMSDISNEATTERSLISWYEIIAISDTKILSDLSTLKSRAPASAPTATADPNDKQEQKTKTPDVASHEETKELKAIRGLDATIKSLIVWLEAATNANTNSVENALLAGLIQKRKIASEGEEIDNNLNEVFQKPIGNSVVGIYFFRSIVSIALICLTIALLQLRTLRNDYVSKWTNLNNRYYFLLEKDPTGPKISSPLWRQFAIDLIDTSMWGHRSFEPHFIQIVKPLIPRQNLNHIHELSEIKEKLMDKNLTNIT